MERVDLEMMNARSLGALLMNAIIPPVYRSPQRAPVGRKPLVRCGYCSVYGLRDYVARGREG